MALTCARCGAQNPDGNRFCNSCGTALVPAAQAPAVPVAAAAGSPAWLAAAPAAPGAYAPSQAYAPQPGYQSPYYAPQPGAGPAAVHRTPWVLIVSIVVVAVLVLGGAGTVLAFALGKHGSQGSSSTFASLSSPSPASSPSAGGTPSPTSQPTPPSGQKVTTPTLSVIVPSGWSVLNKDSNSVTMESPESDGTVTVASGQSSPSQTAQQLKDAVDKALSSRYPDAAPCPGSGSSNGAIAGANGIFWMMCFTATSGGQSASVAEPLWVGANANGSVAYVVVLQTTQDNIDAFVKKCVPILQSGIVWTLK